MLTNLMLDSVRFQRSRLLMLLSLTRLYDPQFFDTPAIGVPGLPFSQYQVGALDEDAMAQCHSDSFANPSLGLPKP